MLDSKLHAIVLKVINRCNYSKFNSFNEIIAESNKTVAGERKSTFMNKEEIEYVRKNPKIYDNFLKICKIVDDELGLQSSNQITTESILFHLNLSINSEVDIPDHFRYLESHSEISGTIDEILVSMDLSPKPYETLDKPL